VKAVADKSSIDKQLQRLEDENMYLQQQVQELQKMLADTENQHAQRLMELSSRNRKESDLETERIRTSHLQTEKTLQVRERNHRTQIKGLEEQIANLRDQLSTEIRKRQNFINHSMTVGDDLKNLHSVLNDSLNIVARDPLLDPILLDYETRRLNESIGGYVNETPVRHRSPNRRTISPSKYKFSRYS